jgi:hypothetical protein
VHIRTLSAAAIAGLTIALSIADAASAYAVHGRHGRPGRIAMVAMQGIHPVDQLPTVAFPQYAQGGIYRSPMSRAKQYICVTYKIWSYDFGAWLVLSRHRECDWVKRGRKVVPDPWEDQVEPHNGYRATVILTWQTRRAT